MARAQNEGGHIDLSLHSFSRSLRSLLSRTMDHLKKLFKKDSLEEKGTSRRKVVRRSRSLPLGHQVEDEPRKATYRGRGPLRVSRIHHVEPEDRSLPNGYLGVPVLDISKVTCDEAAKEWLNRKKVEREIRHPQTQKPLSSSLPRQRRHNHHHPEHNLREFTRLAKEDFSQLFAADDSDSYTTMSSQTDVDEASFFKDKVRSDLQIRYDQSYVQPANRPLRGSQSTTYLKPQVRQGPSRHAEVQRANRHPSQVPLRGELGSLPKGVSGTRPVASNKPLPQLPANLLSARCATASPQPTRYQRPKQGQKVVYSATGQCPPGWF